jgi:hypothetical protein
MAQVWRECTRCRSRRFIANQPGPPKTLRWDGCPECPEIASGEHPLPEHARPFHPAATAEPSGAGS